MRILTKRIYDLPERKDGLRILVDRLWPRGVKKEKANVDEWLKDIAPSDGLRIWFSHDSKKWLEFRRRYHRELQEKEELIRRITGEAKNHTITLLYGAKDQRHNNAVALKEYLESRTVKEP